MARNNKNMKKSNLIITSAAALVALVAVTGIAASSFAATGNIEEARPFLGKFIPGMGRGEGIARDEDFRTEMEAKREAVESAIEANDYNAWVAAVGDNSPVLEKINQDNFGKFVEAHNLINQARDAMKELGLEQGRMIGGRPGIGFGCRR